MRIKAFLLAAVMAAALLTAGCSKSSDSSSKPAEDSKAGSQSSVEASKEESKTESKAEDSKKEESKESSAPSGKPVDASWFDDAVFVGDSVTLKLSYYAENGDLGDAKFLCQGSLGYTNALMALEEEGNVHPSYEGTTYTVDEGCKTINPKKVFVMLGMNDIGNYGTDGAMESARNLIGKLKSKSDGALIYIQSVTPILDGHEYDDLSNPHVRAFNEKLQAFCKEEGYKYLDIYSVMADENGYLRAEYCGDEEAQGIHFTDEACGIWADYLKQNV